MSSDELSPRPLAILLVEDNPEDAFLLERHLKRNGFAPEITRVETATQMLAAFEGDTVPDVVLADYNLPEFSGPAALKLLKGLNVDVPFIMLSGAVTEEIAVSSMRAGAQDFVSKQNLARLVPALERELNELASRRRERAAQQALRASENRFDRLVAAMPLGLLICDGENRITYANGAVEGMLRYSSDALRSGHLTLDSVFADCAPLLDAVQRVERQSQLFETVCKVQDGTTLDALVGVTVLNPEGSLASRQTAIFIADLTMQKKGEELLRRTEKLAVAGRLAGAIAHEINNPLEAIMNCLYLLGQYDLTEESRQLLDAAQSELNRVAQITVQTLRFYRSSTQARAGDVHELIETVVRLLASRIARHGIELIRRYGEIPEIVMYDGEIRQMIANLVSNAIDAMPSGGRMFIHTLRVRDMKTGRNGVRLTVADDGMGMDAETRARIFEPFFSTKGITGTGLGLWISQEIVEKQEGRMRVRSRLSTPERRGGTVITAFLPVTALHRNR